MPRDEERLRQLEQRVRDLEARLGLPAPGVPDSRAPPSAAGDAPGRKASVPLWKGVVEPAPQGARRARDPMLAVRLLARAGILVLALGVVFFLKLAYDRGWVPIPGRFAIGLAGGVLVFAGGELMRRRRMDSSVAQVFAGGGAVVAYVTLYIGYALPEYRAALGMALWADIALLALVSALLAAYAFWMRLPVLCGVAAALAHILVAPAGEFTTLGLLFVVFLDVGFLVVAATRGWSSLVGTVVVGATVVHAVAAVQAGIPWPLPAATVVAIAGLALLALQRAQPARPLLPALAFLAVTGVFAVEALAFERGGFDDAAGWIALAVGIAALALAMALPRLAPGLGAVALLLLLAWPPLQFDGAGLQALALAGMALAATSASLLLSKGRTWVQGAALLSATFALLSVLASMVPRVPAGQVGLAATAMVLALAAGASVFRLHRAEAGQGRILRGLGLGVAMGSAILVVPVLVHGLPITLAWGAEALLLVVLGLLMRDGDLRTASFVMFGLVLVRVFAIDLNSLSLPARVLAFLATGALLLAGAFLYARQRRAHPDPPAP
ncbi:MAG TPA: DUF2339 domain-containing protein [Candidatus Thermoplasmatota archaeon]|nr:DUF2339 domain-containing protein [Candidatus Thermoplasmatota archaeon]